MSESPVARRPPRAVVRFNRVAEKVAGRRWFPVWAQVRHRGRRSGTEYVTPVAVLVTPRTFVIGLPWGAGTDWVRNVLAARGCTVRWRGRDVVATEPVLVDKAVALAAANRFERVVLARLNFPAYLQLDR